MSHRSGAQARNDGSITDARFEAVRDKIVGQGMRVERTPRFPNTVRIYIPEPASLTITESQAEAWAIETRNSLGGQAIVYIHDLNGTITLAKATPWGIERQPPRGRTGGAADWEKKHNSFGEIYHPTPAPLFPQWSK